MITLVLSTVCEQRELPSSTGRTMLRPCRTSPWTATRTPICTISQSHSSLCCNRQFFPYQNQVKSKALRGLTNLSHLIDATSAPRPRQTTASPTAALLRWGRHALPEIMMKMTSKKTRQSESNTAARITESGFWRCDVFWGCNHYICIILQFFFFSCSTLDENNLAYHVPVPAVVLVTHGIRHNTLCFVRRVMWTPRRSCRRRYSWCHCTADDATC